jgi:hypothetical protein
MPPFPRIPVNHYRAPALATFRETSDVHKIPFDLAAAVARRLGAAAVCHCAGAGQHDLRGQLRRPAGSARDRRGADHTVHHQSGARHVFVAWRLPLAVGADDDRRRLHERHVPVARRRRAEHGYRFRRRWERRDVLSGQWQSHRAGQTRWPHLEKWGKLQLWPANTANSATTRARSG